MNIYKLKKEIIAENDVATAHFIDNCGTNAIGIISKNFNDTNYFNMSYKTNEAIFQLARNSQRILDSWLRGEKPDYYTVVYDINNRNNGVLALVIPRYENTELEDNLEKMIWNMLDYSRLLK